MNHVFKNRSEILFLYDCKWANPNGDPLDENKPRIDEETERCIVTDVRLKRTTRDEWQSWGEVLWVSGENVNPEERRKELGIERKEDALKLLDVRLFGAVIPMKDRADTSYTGPVQFRFGSSLHSVKVVYQQGTAAFTTRDAQQRSFREEYLVPYALICFYGIANENMAKITGASEEDMKKLLKGMWLGTKNLITRSKMEHNPRLLLRIVYKENGNWHIGELDSYLKLVTEVDEKSIRDVSQVSLDVTELLKILDQHRDRIEGIELKEDGRLKLLHNKERIELAHKLQQMGFRVEVLDLP